MFELVTSEASYYKSLELLETHFLRNPLLVNTLSQSDMHFLFSNIEDIMKASERCVFVRECMRLVFNFIYACGFRLSVLLYLMLLFYEGGKEDNSVLQIDLEHSVFFSL